MEGTVVNGLTGEPLRRVSVQVMSAPRPMEPVVTDALGRFRLPEQGLVHLHFLVHVTAIVLQHKSNTLF